MEVNSPDGLLEKTFLLPSTPMTHIRQDWDVEIVRGSVYEKTIREKTCKMYLESRKILRKIKSNTGALYGLRWLWLRWLG